MNQNRAEVLTLFFTNGKGSVYHILANQEEGTAPLPCDARLHPYDLLLLRQGRPTPHVVKEKPPGVPLCKHCEKSRGGRF